MSTKRWLAAFVLIVLVWVLAIALDSASLTWIAGSLSFMLAIYEWLVWRKSRR